MRRLSIIFALILFVGCNPKYEYEFRDLSRTLVKKTIRAENDEEAYIIMMQDFDKYFTETNNALEYLDRVVSPLLTNCKTGEYIITGIDYPSVFFERQKQYRKERDSIIAKKNERLMAEQQIEDEKRREEEKKAFAGATFGMNKEEVMKVPFYKNNFYVSGSNNIKGSRIKVGNRSYNINLCFNEDLLYRVLFTNNPETAMSIETDITEDVENFREVIEEVYGKPSFSYDKDALFRIDMTAGAITWAYKWTIGSKTIRVGYAVAENGYKFSVYAEIIDTIVELSINYKLERERNKQIEEAASSLF